MLLRFGDRGALVLLVHDEYVFAENEFQDAGARRGVFLKALQQASGLERERAVTEEGTREPFPRPLYRSFIINELRWWRRRESNPRHPKTLTY